jgi:hypothetical protein
LYESRRWVRKLHIASVSFSLLGQNVLLSTLL